MTSETTKLDELFRCLPTNSGIDPRLVEDAKTELNVLKFRAGSSTKQKTWTKSDMEKLQEQLKEKDTEILLLKRQLIDRTTSRNHSRQRSGLSSGLDSPAKIQASYQELFDDGWARAYDYFSSCDWSDIEIIITLQRILRASFAFCKDVSTEQLQNIEGEALYPSASWMDDNGIIARLQKPSFSREITHLAKMYQRTTARECLPALQKTFVEQVLPTFVDPEKFNDPVVREYGQKCIEISWAMCVQDPPMAFVNRIDRGEDFDHNRFRKYTESDEDKFDFLVWPAMLSHEAGPLLVKGIAQPIGPLPSSPRSKHTRSRNSRQSRFSRQSVDDPTTPRASGTAVSQTPPITYRQAPSRHGQVNPSTPYFEPAAGTPRSSTSVPYRAGPIDEQYSERSFRNTQSESGQRADTDLTVVWRRAHENSRIRTAN